MKRFLFLCSLFLITISLSAQNNVTKFLGIPVDGTKSAMIQKLKEKGFTYNSTYDWLEGEFNGYQVKISIVTENNKVWRIALQDAYPKSETQIKIRFNTLCNQFEQNKKYLPAQDIQRLSETENISYEITVHDKQYQAAFYQLGDINSTDLYAKSNEELEQLSNNMVWFTISKYEYGEYIIVMFYDNLNNHANGEDL
ncbi:MAG: hypothetical protein IJU33_03735 [Bacteroidales bacterium]|nr:hypothetical protein [Bacteroidales bacterium]